MRLSRAEVRLMKAVQSLRGLIAQGADDRQLGDWLRHTFIPRCSRNLIALLPGSVPAVVEDNPTPKRKPRDTRQVDLVRG